MFDPITAQLLQSAPAVPGLDPTDIPALLTERYAELVSARLRGASDDTPSTDDLWPLGRIADTYELIASITSEPAARAASAFVAATAQQILARRQSLNAEWPNIDRDRVDPSLSAAVLFLAAEQYADATEAAANIKPSRPNQTFEATILSENIADLARGRLEEILARAGRWRRRQANDRSLDERALAALLEALITGIEMLAADILSIPTRADANERFASARDAFVRVLDLSSAVSRIGEVIESITITYPGPHHLASLLIGAVDGIAAASLTKMPPPDGADLMFWSNWLRRRAIQHPFIWPNHRQAIAEEFHQTGKSAVVVLPTGAGKTTMSALKIAGVLARGKKAVFLAPTHALVEQLTDDLQSIFPEELLGSVVSNDFDLLFRTGSDLREIEVMTPERCLAMLSFAPDGFSDVGLLVFDECHLLAPNPSRIRRSVDAMLCLLAFAQVVPDADLLLLSAMLKNADEFARWISHLTGRDCVHVDLLWKPSRQARGVVIYRSEDLTAAQRSAAATQGRENNAAGKKAQGLRVAAQKQLQVSAFAVWGLQHNWLGARTARFSIQPVLSEPVLLAGSLRGGAIYLTPNANKIAGRLAVAAALSGLKSIVFVNTKNDAITVARDIANELAGKIEPTEVEKERWAALLDELGDLKHAVLPQPAVAVPHNASMLRLERDLAERMFRRVNGASVIVATPTLAQGLNLPAHLAILAGDKRADALQRGRADLEAHEILNAAARAGRAGHVANGVVLLVPEPIISYEGNSLPQTAIKKLKSVLPSDDRCAVITDPLEHILDRLSFGQELDADARYVVNRMAALGELGAEPSHSLFDLGKSLGAFAARSKAAEYEFETKVADLRLAIAQSSPDDVQPGTALLASKSGLSIQLLSRLRSRIANDIGSLPTDVERWLQWTLRWLGDDDEARESLLHDVNRSIRGACGLSRDGRVTAAELNQLLPGLSAWLHGRPLVEIEIALNGDPHSTKFAKRICPRARDLVSSVVPRGLSFAVGLVSHVASEMSVADEQDGLSLTLIESLATAVRKGYNTPEKVAFANEHPHVLSRVQIHALWLQKQ